MSSYEVVRVELCAPHEEFEPREGAYQPYWEVTYALGWVAMNHAGLHFAGSKGLQAYERRAEVHSRIDVSFVLA